MLTLLVSTGVASCRADARESANFGTASLLGACSSTVACAELGEFIHRMTIDNGDTISYPSIDWESLHQPSLFDSMFAARIKTTLSDPIDESEAIAEWVVGKFDKNGACVTSDDAFGGVLSTNLCITLMAELGAADRVPSAAAAHLRRSMEEALRSDDVVESAWTDVFFAIDSLVRIHGASPEIIAMVVDRAVIAEPVTAGATACLWAVREHVTSDQEARIRQWIRSAGVAANEAHRRRSLADMVYLAELRQTFDDQPSDHAGFDDGDVQWLTSAIGGKLDAAYWSQLWQESPDEAFWAAYIRTNVLQADSGALVAIIDHDRVDRQGWARRPILVGNATATQWIVEMLGGEKGEKAWRDKVFAYVRESTDRRCADGSGLHLDKLARIVSTLGVTGSAAEELLAVHCRSEAHDDDPKLERAAAAGRAVNSAIALSLIGRGADAAGADDLRSALRERLIGDMSTMDALHGAAALAKHVGIQAQKDIVRRKLELLYQAGGFKSSVQSLDADAVSTMLGVEAMGWLGGDLDTAEIGSFLGGLKSERGYRRTSQAFRGADSSRARWDLPSTGAALRTIRLIASTSTPVTGR